jgi:predicted permease
MISFFDIVFKIFPFYFFILLGYFGGKYLDVRKESIAPILIYLLTPVIVFHGVYITKVSLGTLSIPLLYLIIAAGLSISTLKLFKKIWPDSTGNIVAYMAGSANIGYFGLPVAAAILGESAVGIMTLFVLGFTIYDCTVGFFITARGRHTVMESLKKVMMLPAIYAFFISILLNLLQVKFGQGYMDFVAIFRGAFTFLGMMLIGLGLSDIKEFRLDHKLLLITFTIKFLIWPIIMIVIIFLDNRLFHLFTPLIHQVMVLISIVPIAANSVAYATQLKVQPEKASLAVLLSTIFALFYIPLITVIFINK